jgi:adenosine deaminase
MKEQISAKEFINGLPKAELHLHIEGSFEPEQMFELANRNNISMKYKNVEDIREAYKFNNLQEFLDIYYAGAGVLITEQDFYDLTMAYLERAHKQNIIHTEIFFDPQTHTARGVPFKTVIDGIHRAMADGEKKFGITFRLIMCFLRHLDESEAFVTLEEAHPFLDKIIAVGLDSSEVGHPPVKYEKVFGKALDYGFLTVAHAGEEGPADYIRGTLDLLKVSRVDHGNRCLEDPALVKELAERKMPLTVCPLSNFKLSGVKNMADHPLKKLMDKGLHVTVNSDDPAYFGGYINENFQVVYESLNLSEDHLILLAKNSILASFIDDAKKAEYLARIDDYASRFTIKN